MKLLIDILRAGANLLRWWLNHNDFRRYFQKKDGKNSRNS